MTFNSTRDISNTIWIKIIEFRRRLIIIGWTGFQTIMPLVSSRFSYYKWQSRLNKEFSIDDIGPVHKILDSINIGLLFAMDSHPVHIALSEYDAHCTGFYGFKSLRSEGEVHWIAMCIGFARLSWERMNPMHQPIRNFLLSQTVLFTIWIGANYCSNDNEFCIDYFGANRLVQSAITWSVYVKKTSSKTNWR